MSARTVDAIWRRLTLVSAFVAFVAACGSRSGLLGDGTLPTDSASTAAGGSVTGSGQGGGSTSSSAGAGGAGGTGGTGSESPWLVRIGGSESDAANDVVVDAAGNVTVVGTFRGKIHLGSLESQSAGMDDVFVARLDPKGSPIFLHGYGSSSPDGQIVRAAVAPDGRVAFTSRFQGTIDFGLGPWSAGLDDGVFVTVLDPEGKPISGFPITSSHSHNTTAIAFDAKGNLLLAGYYAGPADFAATHVDCPVGQQTLFVLALSPGGQTLYFATFPLLEPFPEHSFSDVQLAVDSLGNAVLMAYYKGTIDFGLGPLGTTGDAPTGLFLVKLDPSGKAIASQGHPVETALFAGGIAIAPDDSVVLTGSFGPHADLGGGPLSASGAAEDVFLARYGPAGDFLFARAFGGSGPVLDVGRAVRAAPDGALWVLALTYGESIDFGSGPLATLPVQALVFKEDGQFSSHLDLASQGVPYNLRFAASGHVLITGAFAKTMTVAGLSATSEGDLDGFVLKLNPESIAGPGGS